VSTKTPELNWSGGKASGAAANADGWSISESIGASGSVSASRKTTRLRPSVSPSRHAANLVHLRV